MPIFLRGPHGLAEKLVGPLGVGALGGEVVGRLVIDGVDRLEVDEVDDLDGPGGPRLDRLELFGLDDHVLAATDVVALHDVGVVDLFAGPLVDPLVADPVGRPFLELVEVDGLVLGGRIEAHRDADQAEAQGSGPDCPRHGMLLSAPALGETGTHQSISTDTREPGLSCPAPAAAAL